MGQSHTPQTRLNNQWNFVDNLGGIEIYKNQTNQLAQKHIIKTDPKIDQQDYITGYYQRYLPSKPIVNVYDAQFLQRSTSMCQNSSVITVYTEYIPYRLSDVKLLNHGQGIYVLSEALAGFSQLYGRVGPFQIYEDLIGFNQQGEVKVWYNPNFADNSVDNDRIILMSTINPYDFDTKFSQNQQHDMIQDTINVIAKYTQFHPQFLQQAQQLKKMSFIEARKILSNQINRKAYYVPDHLFLGDSNDILRKSGVQLKHRHVVDPNKPKKGTKYPYFIDNTNTNHQAHQYNQAYPQENGYTDQYSDSQSSSSSSNEHHQGGYYNLNGENYRIIGSKQIQGNKFNQQVVVDEILRKNNDYSYNQQQQQPSSYQQYSNPNYTQVSTRVVDQHNQHLYYQQQQQKQSQIQYQQQQQPLYVNNNPPLQSQYTQKPMKQYQQGHIVVKENPSFLKNSNTQLSHVQTYQPQPQQAPPQQQQNVRVFSVAENGKLVQERQFNNATYETQPTYQTNVQFQPQYQQNSYQSQGGNMSNVHPLNFAQNNNSDHQLTTFSHRNKIFQPTSPKKLNREQQQIIPQQKAY